MSILTEVSKIKEFFSDHLDEFVIIGGQALIFSAKQNFFEGVRATKDFDILIKDNVSSGFYEKLRFLCSEAGFYRKFKAYLSKDGKNCFFRFSEPNDSDYPLILEFFCYNNSPSDTYWSSIPEHNHMKNICVDDGVVTSIAGLLIDKDLSSFIIRNIHISDSGIRYLSGIGLICLKSLAWFSNKNRRDNGEIINSIYIDKHKEDIFTVLAFTSKEVLASFLKSDDYELFKQEINNFFKENEKDLTIKIDQEILIALKGLQALDED